MGVILGNHQVFDDKVKEFRKQLLSLKLLKRGFTERINLICNDPITPHNIISEVNLELFKLLTGIEEITGSKISLSIILIGSTGFILTGDTLVDQLAWENINTLDL